MLWRILEELQKILVVSQNHVTQNMNCCIKRILSAVFFVEWILNHLGFDVRKSLVPLFFVALSIRMKRMKHQSSAVLNVKSTSRGTRAVHRWCARTANTPSAGTVWSLWMWVGFNHFFFNTTNCNVWMLQCLSVHNVIMADIHHRSPSACNCFRYQETVENVMRSFLFFP